MTGRSLRRFALGALAVLLLAGAATVPLFPAPSADAQELPPLPEEGAPVYAILSPIVAPACAASGTTTLLVPVLGGVIEGELGLDGTSIRNLLLDSLGPVFVVCGALPASPGTRCQLDDQIAGVLPAEVTSLGLPPTIVGNVVDALGAVMSLTGLDAVTASLTPALQCSIAEPPGATDAPPSAPPPPAAAPPASLSAALPPSTGADLALGAPTALPSPAPAPSPGVTPSTPTPTAPAETLVDVVSRSVPGWLKLIQLLAAGFLALFLAGSWLTSLKVARSR